VTVTILAPVNAALPALPAGQSVVRFGTAMELVSALRGLERAVLVSDGLADLAPVADAIRAHKVSVIEVHSAGWDGTTHSVLTEACRGVIGGFGPNAVLHALAAME
jgi:3-dehydroquinate dehydratase